MQTTTQNTVTIELTSDEAAIALIGLRELYLHGTKHNYSGTLQAQAQSAANHIRQQVWGMGERFEDGIDLIRFAREVNAAK